MKKIAIMTLYYNNSNYGGILQAYALQKFLEMQGYESKQISYDYKNPENKIIKKIKKNGVLRFFYYLVKNRKYEVKLSRQSKKICEFAKTIPHTNRMTRKDLKRLNSEYDCFICGSDQIWNPIGWQPPFFLDFVDESKCKISYSASIAVDELDREELLYLCNYISRFNNIAIREQHLQNVIETNLKRKINVVPDPTFLLGKDDWSQITQLPFEDEYVFAYFLGNDCSKLNQVKLFAQNNNLKFYAIPYINENLSEWTLLNNDFRKDIVSVNEFLGLIKGAKIIFSDSFHGCVFSIIFGKKFYVMDRFEKDDKNSMNSRIYSLFETLDFVQIDKDDISKCLLNELWDDANIGLNEKMEEFRKIGVDYLMDSLV